MGDGPDIADVLVDDPNIGDPNITVVLPDGSERQLPHGSTVMDLSLSIGKRLAADAVCAKLEGKLVDLSAKLTDGAQVEVITKQSPQGLHTIRHSTAHVLAQAVLALFRSHLRHRPANRARILLRLQAAGRRHVFAGRHRPNRAEDARDHGSRPAV